MNNLPKSLTVALLAMSFLFSGVNAAPVSAQNTAGEKMLAVELSDEEQDWLAKHPSIKLGFNPDMQPLLIQDENGINSGILPDIYAQLQALTGLNISFKVGPWHETIKKARQGEIDGLLLCIPALAEASGLSPTREYISSTLVVFGKSDAPFQVNNIDDLKGKRVAYLRAVKFIENILATMGSETIAIAADSFIAALTMVLEGKADVALGINFNTYLLHRSGLTGIEPIFIDPSHTTRVVTAVRSDWPELVGILNKGLDRLGDAHITRIIGTWTQLETRTQKDRLTQAEKNWLMQHPVMRLGIDPGWAPVEYFDDDGKLAGITSDNIRILTEKMGTRFEAVKDLTWSEVLQQARQGKIDIIPAISKSDERGEYLLFTEPYLKLPMVIVTRDDAPVIEGIQDLQGRTIAVMEDYITHSYLKRDYPNQQLLLFKTLGKALQAVESGKADALIENAASVNLTKNELGLTRLSVAATTPYAYELSVGVRKDWPELIPILNKILASISTREKQIIKEKWVDIRFRKQIDWQLVIWFSLAIVLIAGGIIATFLISNRRLAREVVKRKQAEEVIKAVNRELTFTKFAFDNAPDAIQWLDADSADMVYVNKLAGEILGYSQEELMKLAVFDIAPLSHQYAWPGFLAKMRQQGHMTFESVWRRKDGSRFPVEISARSLTYEGTEYFLAFIRDIRKKKQAQEELQAAKETAEAANRELTFTKFAFDNAPDGIEWLLADNAQMVYVNKESGKMLGYSQEDLLKLAVFDFDPVYNQDAWPDFRKQLLQQGQMTFESIWNRKDGSRFPVEISARSLTYEGTEYFLAFIRDISGKKQDQKELQAAKEAAESANQAKSAFLANMSHEIRTPLNAILGFSSMLGRDPDATPSQKEKLVVINKSGEHLLAMINDILDLSKIEAGRIELEETPFDLVALLQEISAMIQSRAAEKGLSYQLKTEAITLPYVFSDSGKLRQILINLLGNAVKFTSQGTITLRAATETLAETPERCRIVLEVEDTGPGIDPGRQKNIFEPFVREQGVSAQTGTGLGLSICKNFAELMDGTIEIESAAGKGAMFRVRLPAGIVEAADIDSPMEIKPNVIGLVPGQKVRRILIADDHPANRLLLKTLLEDAGFAIIEAQNGQEALEAFEKEAPDFIWMDMRMPVMDGYEAVRQIRRRPGGEKLPIVAITASVFKSQQPEILAAGCDDIVFKPFRTYEIFEMMGRSLGLEYAYAEPDDAPVPVHEAELTSAMLAELPPELLEALDETTLVANREVILKVIDRIQEHAPETAEHLRVLVQNFEIDRIRELLAEVG